MAPGKRRSSEQSQGLEEEETQPNLQLCLESNLLLLTRRPGHGLVCGGLCWGWALFDFSKQA